MPLEREKWYLPRDVSFLEVTVKTESTGLGGEEMDSFRMFLPRLQKQQQQQLWLCIVNSVKYCMLRQALYNHVRPAMC